MMPKREKYPLIVYNSFGRWQTVFSRNPTPILIVLLFFGLGSYLHGVHLTAEPTLSRAALRGLASHCAEISPISEGEYLERQTKLAHVLHSLGGQAYIAEPGANTQYFANFSKAEWYLSERPLLLIISPVTSESGILPQVTILTPKFEAARARLLSIPSVGKLNIHYVEWPEEANPYYTALHSLPRFGEDRLLYVDESIRKFMADGLERADPRAKVVSAPPPITTLRERKSESEIRILRCANEATLLAIREVYRKLYPGIRESQARNMMVTALAASGLNNGGCLTLFGENAALPHGRGTDRTLSKADLALFDCTASLHGYYSDVSRTVAIDFEWLSPKQLKVWHIVKVAQSVALEKARNGTRTGYIDESVRALLRLYGGYDEYFTHRLGHGIGLEVHEHPYLRGGNDAIIQIGHTFSNEPGLYIEDYFGVRLEDCFYVAEDGSAVYLTQGVGGAAKSPWNP